jgi:hypothetical protein
MILELFKLPSGITLPMTLGARIVFPSTGETTVGAGAAGERRQVFTKLIERLLEHRDLLVHVGKREGPPSALNLRRSSPEIRGIVLRLRSH